eukprot:jgi/Undpi1/2670/HiC_scaffold_13.g06048.m1
MLACYNIAIALRGQDDALAPAAEAANERLRPLSCNSVLAVVTTVLQCVKREAPRIQAHSLHESSILNPARLAAGAVVSAIKEDPLGADLLLTFLGMAVSSYRRDTVSSPFPQQLESEGCERAYATLMKSLDGIPDMVEMLRWTDPATELLKLPPVAVLTLHFVLVFLPTKLRLSGRGYASTPLSASASTYTGKPLSFIYKPAGASPVRADAARRAVVTGKNVLSEGSVGAGGAGASGGAVSTHLGSVPSYVFDVVLPSDPAFDAEARLGGYTIAYHGSSPENFHSILNTGLRVMSGSRLMKNGAAFGNGVYLSGSRKAAAAFACRGDGTGTTVWPKSAFGAGGTESFMASLSSGGRKKFGYRVVAKCRVLKGDGVKEIEGWGEEETYFVVSDTSRVRVESLLLFDEGQLSESGASATSATKNTPKVEKQVNTKASEGKGGKGAQCQGRGVSGAARRVYRPRVAAAAGAGNAWSPDADGVAVKIFHPCVVVLAALGVLLVTFS